MWFVVLVFSVNDPKFGRVKRTIHWDATVGNWDGFTATPYRSREEAEAVAVFLAPAILCLPNPAELAVVDMNEIYTYYWP